jgi:hypothetical protein
MDDLLITFFNCLTVLPIDRRTRNIKDRAAAMMVKMVQLKKQGRSSAELIRDETKRIG